MPLCSTGYRRYDFGADTVVSSVVPAQDFSVEFWPCHRAILVSGTWSSRGEGVTRRTNTDQWLTGGQMGPDSVKLLVRRSATADADEHQIRLSNRLGKTWEIVLVRGVGVYKVNLKTVRFQM